MKVQLVPLAQQDLLEKEVDQAKVDQLGLLEDQALKDLQALPEKRVFQGKKVPLALLVEMECKDLWVSLDQLDHLEFLEKTEIRVKLVNMDKKEAKATRENMVPLGHPVLLVLLDSQVLRALMESLAHVDSREFLEQKEMKAPEVSQVLQDPLDYRGCLVHLERRVKPATLALWAHQDHLDLADQQDPLELMDLKVLLEE